VATIRADCTLITSRGRIRYMAPSAFPGAIRLLLLGAILTSISSCSPSASVKSRHNLEDLPYAHKRDGGFFSVLGVAGLGDSSVHPRLEIRELEKNADQWNVYLLGLRRFQSTTQSDRLSYYQIAGTLCSPVTSSVFHHFWNPRWDFTIHISYSYHQRPASVSPSNSLANLLQEYMDDLTSLGTASIRPRADLEAIASIAQTCFPHGTDRI
jgi:hypothetical protein